MEYHSGVSAETVGAKAICMHFLTMKPGDRAKAHLHEDHETAIYAISGETEMWWGDDLAEHMVIRAGDMLYIPAGVPHLPMNRSDAPASVVLARTDPNEQESVVLLPELEENAPV